MMLVGSCFAVVGGSFSHILLHVCWQLSCSCRRQLVRIVLLGSGFADVGRCLTSCAIQPAEQSTGFVTAPGEGVRISNTVLDVSKLHFGFSTRRPGLSSMRFALSKRRFGLSKRHFGLSKRRVGLSKRRFGLSNKRFGLST